MKKVLMMLISILLISCGVQESSNSCGNGLLNSNEQCDDGNLLDNDGCNSECYLEEGSSEFSKPINFHIVISHFINMLKYSHFRILT